jgi:hypothetical protein
VGILGHVVEVLQDLTYTNFFVSLPTAGFESWPEHLEGIVKPAEIGIVMQFTANVDAGEKKRLVAHGVDIFELVFACCCTHGAPRSGTQHVALL